MLRFDEKMLSLIHFKKIVKVSNSEIHIQMKLYDILIYGEDLRIEFFNKDEVILKGKIMKVEFAHERV